MGMACLRLHPGIEFSPATVLHLLSKAIPMSESKKLRVINHDDRTAVKRLLKADSSLARATLQVPEPRLFQGKITRWLYAGDTPLHLATAGYRVEIVQLLLATGADPL